ncbi:condensin complex component [Dorcoceras hygrometricum]|uniref:Condensin complex component n=1 Tax=Dorcoceras hygrometricum TaxID=472368 RepID=A0A2Z6ZSQ5_9LAMI|nr:condensin complex component [Dorcoceras hygrometricum]
MSARDACALAAHGARSLAMSSATDCESWATLGTACRAWRSAAAPRLGRACRVWRSATAPRLDRTCRAPRPATCRSLAHWLRDVEEGGAASLARRWVDEATLLVDACGALVAHDARWPRGVVRCRHDFCGGGASYRPPLRRSSGDVVTADFSRVWFWPVPGSP